jgi:hypothetical protein
MSNWSFRKKRDPKKGVKPNDAGNVPQYPGHHRAAIGWPMLLDGFDRAIDIGTALYANPQATFGLQTTWTQIGGPDLIPVLKPYSDPIDSAATQGTEFSQLGGNPPFGGFSTEIAIGGE